MVNFDEFYSDRAGKMRKSEIRELLKVTQDPEIISFAGGLPNPLSFPISDLKIIVQNVLNNHGKVALQYGATQGINELREIISERSHKEGMTVGASPENLMITSGSQQALDAVGKIFLNPGDVALVGLPSYLGGINAFRSYEANLVGVPLDKDGIQMDLLEEKIKELIKQDQPVKFIYTIPTFQNPAGTVLPESRRKKMIEIAHEYNLLIIEDDPYSKLRYDSAALKPIKAFDDEGRVIYMSTFSKILAPGLRLAWIIASEEVMRKLALCKQAQDLCSAPFSQYIAYEYMKSGSMDLHIMKICEMYKPKRNIMMDSMKLYFPDGYICNRPKGGMFAWVTLPEQIDTEAMFLDAFKEKVAYVHGKAFCVDGGGSSSMRLNFSYSTNEQLDEGMKRLGTVIERKMKVLCR
ncbi:MAG: Multiple substrate aminotransferase [Thermoplasmatales archaeon]|jgi:2-aminoadipate transaminase|nr:Multiple substrate aminotransferase [Thermoplasmatales archaeon]MCU0849811.1 PLP-dependent aminotransferase family protein [Candidatus Thermoplasmatota archaeon]